MILHNRPTIGREEISAISRVINSKYIVQGKEVKKFENAFAEYYNLKSWCKKKREIKKNFQKYRWMLSSGSN